MKKHSKIILDPNEWDFRSILEAQLETAMIYEYSRECPEVVELFNNWLDSELIMQTAYGDPQGYPQGVAVRTAIEENYLSLAANEPEPEFVLNWYQCCPSEIRNHPLFSVNPVLSCWPRAFQTLTNEDWFDAAISDQVDCAESIARMDDVLSVFHVDGKPAFEKDYRYSSKPKKLPKFTFEIDLNYPRPKIVSDFEKWLKKIHVRDRGRKKGKVRPREALKALSALRLSREQIPGRGQKYNKVVDAISHHAPDEFDKVYDKGFSILPIYLNAGAYAQAVKRAKSLCSFYDMIRLRDSKA